MTIDYWPLTLSMVNSRLSFCPLQLLLELHFTRRGQRRDDISIHPGPVVCPEFCHALAYREVRSLVQRSRPTVGAGLQVDVHWKHLAKCLEVVPDGSLGNVGPAAQILRIFPAAELEDSVIAIPFSNRIQEARR